MITMNRREEMIEYINSIGSSDDEESEQERQWWEVAVRPPEETDEDPREIAERLYASLYGHGRFSFEIHSDGPNIELKIVVLDRGTAETIARHVRSELGARADVRKANIPIEAGDPLAVAEFSIEKDVVFPLETVRTSESECGQLHHLLDTFAADDVRGVYQVVCDPVEDDWTARRSRSFPDSVPEDRDTEQELKHAGMAMVPIFGLSLWLSPWPFATALVVGCALVMAATVGEGVTVPEWRTGGEIAREYRERMKALHGAQSRAGKQAEEAADEIIAQTGHSGWRASIRLIVGHDRPMLAEDIRSSLVSEIEGSFASETTGQTLSSSLSSGTAAREVRDHVRSRHLGRPSPSEYLSRLLAQGTRRDLHVGPGELGVLGYFPGEDGGGGDSREFVDVDESESDVPIPDTAPRPSVDIELGSDESAAELFDSLEWHIEPDNIVKETHPELGEIPLLQLEYRPGDESDIATYTEEVHQLLKEDDDFMLFGYAEEGGTIRFFGIDSTDLAQDMLIVGGSGSGKSTFAKNEVVQHAWANRGCMVVDPHEGLINEIQQAIPAHRQDDVVRIDPADIESAYTHVINMLEIDTEPGESGYNDDVDGAVGDVVGMLGQGAVQIGDRMEATMKGIVRGAIKSEKTYTFADLRKVLREEAARERFRQQMLADGFTQLAEFAEDLMEMDTDALAPVIRLFDEWIIAETTRELIRHTGTTLNWDEIVRGDQLLLVNTDIYNDDMQKMFSTYFVKWTDRACRRRPEGERDIYPIVIDEADDILTDEMGLDETLGNGRKYGISLTLITQEPSSISSIEDKLLNNCKTVVSFRIKNKSDKRTMGDLLACDRDEVSSLGDHIALVQTEFDDEVQGPYRLDMLGPAPPTMTTDDRDQLSAESKRQYGRERSELDGVNTLRGEAKNDVIEADGGQEETATPVEAFLAAAREGVEEGVIEESEHYKFVYQDTPRERLRINPSKTIDALDTEDINHPRFEEISDHAREAVENDDSFVLDHGQYTTGIGNCLGIALDGVDHPRISVEPGDF